MLCKQKPEATAAERCHPNSRDVLTGATDIRRNRNFHAYGGVVVQMAPNQTNTMSRLKSIVAKNHLKVSYVKEK